MAEGSGLELFRFRGVLTCRWGSRADTALAIWPFYGSEIPSASGSALPVYICGSVVETFVHVGWADAHTTAGAGWSDAAPRSGGGDFGTEVADRYRPSDKPVSFDGTTRKLSVTVSRNSARFSGRVFRKNLRIASVNRRKWNNADRS